MTTWGQMAAQPTAEPTTHVTREDVAWLIQMIEDLILFNSIGHTPEFDARLNKIRESMTNEQL